MEDAMKDELKRLLAEKERQDREFARVAEQLRALGAGARIVVPPGFFEELDAISAAAVARVPDTTPRLPLGLRA
jgi:hypothetical protein